MILNDEKILEYQKKHEMIKPFNEELVQPASADLLLGQYFDIHRPGSTHITNPHYSQEKKFDSYDVPQGHAFYLAPNELVLGHTHEIISMPDDLVGRVEGKSSLGRLGLLTHVTAGFIDPGFVGQITLELVNLSRVPIALFPGMRIAQICFESMMGPAKNAYGTRGNHYQGQTGPQPSLIHKNFEVYDVY